MFRRFLRQPGLFAHVLLATLMVHLLGLASTVYVMQVFNRFVSYGVTATLVALTVGVFVAVVFELAFRVVRQRFMQALCAEPERDTTTNVGVMLATANANHLTDDSSPQRILRTLETWQSTYSPANLTAVIDAPFAILLVGVVALLSVKLALVIAGAIVLLVIITVVSRLLQKNLQRALREQQGQWQEVSSSLGQSDTIRAFNGAGALLKKYGDLVSSLQRVRYRSADQGGMAQSLSTMIVALSSVGVVALGSMDVVAGTMTIGAVIGANILSSRSLAVFVRLITLTPSLAQAEQAHQRIGSFMQTPRERPDGLIVRRASGAVCLTDLTFGYPEASSPLFDGFHAQIASGDVVWVQGDNASGKTTFARLLTGLITPQRGMIDVDGTNLQQLDMSSYRSQLVYWPQEARFLADSLIVNLTVMNPRADSQEVMQALTLVGLEKFIRQSPAGVSMMLTAQAEELSYGVRRKLALARALLSQGPIWILDEPLEGMDSDGVACVKNLIDQGIKAGRTMILCGAAESVLPSRFRVLDLNATAPAIMVAKSVLKPRVVVKPARTPAKTPPIARRSRR